jgi:two-component system, LytTR family, response regulator
MAIKVILADDEVLARQKLRQFLQDESDIEIVGEGATALETIDLVQFTNPDLVLLDIQMPGMDGFDIISALCTTHGSTPPRIIFTTAYDQYALRAFEINAIDYLLKPFTRERLKQAIQRARDHIHTAPPLVSNGTVRPATAYSTRIVFKSKGRILFLPVEEIRWVGAEENYVRICTERDTHLLRETMARFESKLDPKVFLRVHRSAIVNLQHVKEIRTDAQEGDGFVMMRDGQRVPISRAYRARITQLLVR